MSSQVSATLKSINPTTNEPKTIKEWSFSGPLADSPSSADDLKRIVNNLKDLRSDAANVFANLLKEQGISGFEEDDLLIGEGMGQEEENDEEEEEGREENNENRKSKKNQKKRQGKLEQDEKKKRRGAVSFCVLI